MLVERSNRHPAIQMIPLIDVLSFLLIFFMLFSNFRANPAGISVDLPSATQATTENVRELVITVDRTGRFYSADGPLHSSGVTEWIRTNLANSPNLVVTVKADKETAYESVVSAIDAVRAAGAERLQLAVAIASEPLH